MIAIRPAAAFALGIALWAGLASAGQTNPSIPDRYDETFRKYAKRYFGSGFDWRIFKAQAMTESGLDPDAQSGAGAVGLMQMLPSTLGDVRSHNKELALVDDISLNIAAGIFHDRELWEAFTDTVDPHRLSFTLGSYNAGYATMRRAQKFARDHGLDDRVWSSIEVVAPAVTEWRYQETFEYVRRIRAYVARMDRAGRVR